MYRKAHSSTSYRGWDVKHEDNDLLCEIRSNSVHSCFSYRNKRNPYSPKNNSDQILFADSNGETIVKFGWFFFGGEITQACWSVDQDLTLRDREWSVPNGIKYMTRTRQCKV